MTCLQRTVSRPREGGGRWAGAASISRMTYHEWGMASARAPAGSLTPLIRMSNECHGPRDLRQREGTYKSEGRIIILYDRLTSLSILARLGASEGRSDLYIEVRTDDQASSPGPSPWSDRRLSCPGGLGPYCCLCSVGLQSQG